MERSTSVERSGDDAHISKQPRLTRRRALGMAGLGLVGLTGAGGVWLWNQSLHPIFVYRGHASRVSALAWSADSKRIVSGDLKGSIRIWERATGKTLLAYQGHTDVIWAIAWSPNGQLVASASATDHEVKVWDATTGNQIQVYQGHSSFISALSWSPDTTYIASGSHDGTVQVWNPITGKPISIFGERAKPTDRMYVEDIAWSPNGKHIASVSTRDRQLFMWDAYTGSTVLTPQGDLAGGIFPKLAWSADSKRMCAFSEEDRGQMDWPTTGQVWDTTTGKTVFTSPALYTGVLQDVAWVLDGKGIAFTTTDNVHIWDITGGHFWISPSFASESSILYHANIMVSSPERKYTAGDNDNEVLIWEIPHP